jgi:hypothetical protein
MTKTITPQTILKQAYDDSSSAIEFCNWYITNRKSLELHEMQLIDIAYQDGVNDATQDADHTFKPMEYVKEAYGFKQEQNNDN